MPWAFVRPTDPEVLSGRPLLDLGTGDGQTIAALTERDGLIVGIDRSIDALVAARRLVRVVCGEAERLSFATSAFATVLAADLFHHLDDVRLSEVLAEIRRVLGPSGRLVAWWYAEPARPAPDAPRFPRIVEAVTDVLRRAGFASVNSLALEAEDGPRTVGVVAS